MKRVVLTKGEVSAVKEVLRFFLHNFNGKSTAEGVTYYWFYFHISERVSTTSVEIMNIIKDVVEFAKMNVAKEHMTGVQYSKLMRAIKATEKFIVYVTEG